MKTIAFEHSINGIIEYKKSWEEDCFVISGDINCAPKYIYCSNYIVYPKDYMLYTFNHD